MTEISQWISDHGALGVALFFGGLAIWLLMPRRSPARGLRALGVVSGVMSLVIGGLALFEPSDVITRDIVFCVFSVVAIVGGVLTITSHDPIYGALGFALATLGVCGLFLLGSAPFLAAATAIVYAGAIVVVFVFVIMLARQHGQASYDRQPVSPALATILVIVLLGGLLSATDSSMPALLAATEHNPTASVLPPAHPLSQTNDKKTDSMRDLGRSLFGDYLFAVELAGTALMAAAIGAIAIVPRRSHGTL